MKWPKILGRTSTSTGEEGAEKPEAARNPKMFRNLNPLPLGIELPFAEILPLAAEFGFPSIELPLPYLMEASREQIQEAAAIKHTIAQYIDDALHLRWEHDLIAEGDFE